MNLKIGNKVEVLEPAYNHKQRFVVGTVLGLSGMERHYWRVKVGSQVLVVNDSMLKVIV